MTEFTCLQCVHAGNPHIFSDVCVVECRHDVVTINGFPIVKADSWCTPGKNDTPDTAPSGEEPQETAEDEDNTHDFITRKNNDGSILTLHIPTTIMQLHDQVTALVQESNYNKRWSLWHLIRRS